MKDEIQIKAELIEYQHDAMIEFYKTYNRLFVNKVLLRLCESCFPLFPPSLANFVLSERRPDARVRNVVIRLDRKAYPNLWQFYKDLPYGARSTVIVNVLNRFVQIADANKQLMESAYWGTLSDEGPGLTPSQEAAAAPAPAAEGSHSSMHESQPVALPEGEAKHQEEPVKMEASQVSQESEADDPLENFKVSL